MTPRKPRRDAKELRGSGRRGRSEGTATGSGIELTPRVVERAEAQPECIVSPGAGVDSGVVWALERREAYVSGNRPVEGA